MLPKYKLWNKKEQQFVDLENAKEEYVFDLSSGLIISLTKDNKLKEEVDYIEVLWCTNITKVFTTEAIYEADIVKTHYGEHGRHIGVVEFVSGQFVSRGVKQYEGEIERLNGTFEILGNKFENPDLIYSDEVE